MSWQFENEGASRPKLKNTPPMKIFKNFPLHRNQRKRILRLRRRANNQWLVAEVKHRLGGALSGRQDSRARDLPLDHLDPQQPKEMAAFHLGSPRANGLQNATALGRLFRRQGQRVSPQPGPKETLPMLPASFASEQGKELQ